MLGNKDNVVNQDEQEMLELRVQTDSLELLVSRVRQEKLENPDDLEVKVQLDLLETEGNLVIPEVQDQTERLGDQDPPDPPDHLGSGEKTDNLETRVREACQDLMGSLDQVANQDNPDYRVNEDFQEQLALEVCRVREDNLDHQDLMG